MIKDRSIGRRIFVILNSLFFIIFALSCIIPMIHVLAISLSASSAVTAGQVTIFPVKFTLKSYQYILNKPEYWRAMGISFKRVVLGVGISMLMNILASYPLSKSKAVFKHQPLFSWYFVITMLFSGGLVPTYMVVKYTGLIDSIGALVIPGAVSVFNVLLLSNFFRSIPKEIEESAFIDGAGHFRILIQLYLPLSLPILATLIVFSVVGHWNAWFDGLIYMNNQKNYPMQSYLQTILMQTNVMASTKAYAELLSKISDRTLKCAQVFIATIPVLLIYPFLQNYFISGIMVGSVKE